MYGHSTRISRRDRRDRREAARSPAPPPPPPPQHNQNPNYLLPNPNLAPQLIQNPNIPVQFAPVPVHYPDPREVLERVERAAVKARDEIIAAGESVTTWKVIQAVLLMLEVASWESLGFHLQQVPSLYRLMLIEGKVDAFIRCFVEVRKITSLYDLESAICKNEGTEKFEELDLGPLVRHPLVMHYFGATSEVKDVFKITTEEIITFLSTLMRKKHKNIKADELLDFIAKKKSVDRNELLGVRIQNLGMHMSQIYQGWNSEQAAIKNYIGEDKPTSNRKRRKHLLFTSEKKQLDEHFGRISECVNSLTSTHEEFCGNFQNPNYPVQPAPSPVDELSLRPRSNEAFDIVDRAVLKARGEISAAGESVTAWKVGHAVLLVLKADSWESLGFEMKQVPSLKRLMVIEGEVNAFIHCFVGVQKITSLYDLELAICNNVGTEKFEELDLGPLVRHPLVMHYFGASLEVKDVFKITTEEIITYLSYFMREKHKSAKVDELLDFIAKKKSVDRKELLGVRIKSLGMHRSQIHRGWNSEQTAIKKYIGDDKPTSDSKRNKHVLLTSPEEQLDEHLCEDVGDSSSVGDDNDIQFKMSKARKNKLRMFISTWKEACRENNDTEVLNRMIQFYGTKKAKKVKAMFLQQPCAELLNVAVDAIKTGICDSLYDTLQTLNQQGVANSLPEKCTEAVSTEVEPAEKNSVSIGRDLTSQHSITTEDILKKLVTYFANDIDTVGKGNTSFEAKIKLSRMLSKFEFWLAEQFAVENFQSLGYGDFLTFIKKHISLLPYAFQTILSVEMCENISLDVCMLQPQLDVLLDQASNSLLENEILSEQKISDLLARQFPSICLKLVTNGSLKHIEDFLKGKKHYKSSNSVLFSATLFGKSSSEDIFYHNINPDGSDSCIGHNTGVLGTASTKDALEALVRAPMLTDLDSWSHWSHKFYPSFGPFLPWLLTEVNAKELLCLVTKEGTVLRIDPSASLDSFLEAFLRGSSFETAVQLLSLVALYGGDSHVPLSLLKCHARKAFEVIIRNSLDDELNNNKEFGMHGKPLDRELFFVEAAYNGKNKNICGSDRAMSVAAKFILDCLGYLPVEVHKFVTSLLLSGLQYMMKEAPLAILNECNNLKQRCMIHDVGLSLGIVEWINDYNAFCLTRPQELILSSTQPSLRDASFECTSTNLYTPKAGDNLPLTGNKMSVPFVTNQPNEQHEEVSTTKYKMQTFVNITPESKHVPEGDDVNSPDAVVESIRREEFGLDPNLIASESSLLKKQHARLGRALHCLSQELYSQDSHFLLELVQNADDNVYSGNVEPTLTFILMEGGIVVLNNERGFSGDNIRALCDVGNSTKKEPTAGYIGKKGIGFKSVFRVSDAPEIHSNGFHIKFDISEGQIGFILPTMIPPCDVEMFSKLVKQDADENDNCWNTCIVLPFRSKSEALSMNKITSMFSDLHPSLLLFLHRLQCIRFRNMLDGSFTVMKKEILGSGIIKVSLGNEKLTWFVATDKLKPGAIRPDAETTEISIAFTLSDLGNEEYIPCLDQQPVFAYLPLRTYGLKFIIQGDFILPSSREEVDGDSPWNQWLLSEFPRLFVSAENSFCSLPCFREKQGKAVSAFMSFVPLVGEVHGFFFSVPRMIISELRRSNCLLLDGDIDKWVPPCKVIRNWTDQTRNLLPDSLLSQHLGLGLLHRDTILSDTLANALGIEEYGPRILLQVLSSLCSSRDGLMSIGFSWLSSWLNAMYLMSFHSGQVVFSNTTELDILTKLRKLPFIPLSDGKYASLTEGTIWLHSDADNEYIPEAFPKLHANLRTVNPVLSAVTDSTILQYGPYTVDNITKMLCLAGVEKLSAHEIVKVHILPALSSVQSGQDDNEMMIEYLAFVMFHLQSKCSHCSAEREQILSELRSKAHILTNYGYKRLADTAIHFSNDFGNPIDMNKLIDGIEMKWHEIDNKYLKHPITKSVSDGILKWRNFFQELGVNDFVQVVETKKCASRISNVLNFLISEKDMISLNSIVNDWESHELIHLLSQLSSIGDRGKCNYLLEVFDTLWDEYFGNKVNGFCNTSSAEKIPFKSSFLSSLHDVKWIATAIGEDLYYPKDVFHDCKSVRSILGVNVPYAVPKVKSAKLLNDLGFKIHVTLDDILSILQVWRTSQIPLKATISQMSKLYTCISNEMVTSSRKIMSTLTSEAFIFVPDSAGSSHQVLVSGVLRSSGEVYWHDLTGSVDWVKGICPSTDLASKTHGPCSTMLKSIYPGLHDFFVNKCEVQETPPFRNYLQILQQLSAVALPSQAAKIVLQVFLTCADGLKSGVLSSKDIDYLKECLLNPDYTVLPTSVDRWISLHPSFGLVCWSDDEKLRKEFKHCDHIEFIYFGELSDEERETLQKISVFMRHLGIHALSEVVTQEAIYYGPAESGFKTLLINWALPFAQRYIYKSYPDRYNQLKQPGYVDIFQLRIVVVGNLYYRNVIKRSDISSKNRHECNCLLQGNVLYVTQESDSHSIFLELSRQLVDGNPELHLANFLHMIRTLVESGSTEEQTEFFILNSQKVPKLPEEESAWTLSYALQSAENDSTQVRSVTTSIDKPISLSKSRYNVNSNWPPADWKTAPGLGSAYGSGLMTQPCNNMQLRKEKNDDKISRLIGSTAISKANAERTVKDKSAAPSADVNIDLESLEDQPDYASNMVLSGMEFDFDSVDLVSTTEGPSTSSVIPFERDQLSFGNANVKQALLTGRLGELVAYKHFSGKFGTACVKWVNETHETGLPYDIVVGDEYIEVKATKSAKKDWFNITAREWQFAAEKGECYSIARVTVRGNDMAKLTIFKNPARLCQLGQLQLAILIPKQQHIKELSVVP